MEASVCGPVPPFSFGLGGKLVVGFLAHPDIVALPRFTKGSVLEQSFSLQDLKSQLPDTGLLAITTKGLYALHSPMYHRSELPGVAATLRLKHIDNTEGTTTTFCGERTARLARLVLDYSEDLGTRQVSRVYGTGGAKRHRTIETASSLAGLPSRLVAAGIRRPIYGATLVDNPQDVIWTGAAPHWQIDSSADSESYALRATEMWRRRWLEKAVVRIGEYAFVPSALRLMALGATDGEC